MTGYSLPIAFFFVGAGSAFAQQWTSVVLHPAGARSSQVYAVTPDQQGGVPVFPPNSTRAGIWMGTPESWARLSPPGSSYAVVLGMDDPQQVGSASLPSASATLWYGTQESLVVLQPPGWATSGATALRGGIQVGGGTITYGPPQVTHGGFWRGTAESFVDLHPAGAIL